ncbi:MAG: hypothetical protein FJ104_14470, partial [Deltaproteobacteria bacterium]|nr:hypothetical protein [Deltaproteobacteria bacterium]
MEFLAAADERARLVTLAGLAALAVAAPACSGVVTRGDPDPGATPRIDRAQDGGARAADAGVSDGSRGGDAAWTCPPPVGETADQDGAVVGGFRAGFPVDDGFVYEQVFSQPGPWTIPCTRVLWQPRSGDEPVRLANECAGAAAWGDVAWTALAASGELRRHDLRSPPGCQVVPVPPLGTPFKLRAWSGGLLYADNDGDVFHVDTAGAGATKLFSGGVHPNNVWLAGDGQFACVAV